MLMPNGCRIQGIFFTAVLLSIGISLIAPVTIHIVLICPITIAAFFLLTAIIMAVTPPMESRRTHILVFHFLIGNCLQVTPPMEKRRTHLVPLKILPTAIGIASLLDMQRLHRITLSIKKGYGKVQVLNIKSTLGTSLKSTATTCGNDQIWRPRSLNRDFNLAELLKPYHERAFRRGFKLLRRLSRSYRDWDRLIEMIPRNLADILQRVREGQVNLTLGHQRADTTVNRYVYGILTTALFLGSCMLVSRKMGTGDGSTLLSCRCKKKGDRFILSDAALKLNLFFT